MQSSPFAIETATTFIKGLIKLPVWRAFFIDYGETCTVTSSNITLNRSQTFMFHLNSHAVLCHFEGLATQLCIEAISVTVKLKTINFSFSFFDLFSRVQTNF
jgi:hypothetical protein